MRLEILGAIIFFIVMVAAMFTYAPSYDDVSQVPDKPLTAEQQDFYGFNQ